MIKKSVFSQAVLAFCLCAGMMMGVTACQKSGDDEHTHDSASVDSQNTSGSQQSTQNSELPVLKVATYGSMPPFAFLNEKGELVGIDIDTIEAIGRQEGFTVKLNSMPWQNLFASVEAGENDLAIAGISYNADRAAKYGLTKSYLFVPAAIMSKKSSHLNVKELADLKGRNVGGIAASKQVLQMKEVGGANKIAEPETIFLAFQQMVKGDLDAIFEDQQVLEYLAKQYPDYDFDIVAYEDKTVPDAQQIIMTKKSNEELLKKLNDGIDKLVASGEMKRIEKKWLGERSQS